MYPVLALDYGTKRIGVAISDKYGIVATPLSTLRFTKNQNIIDLISQIVSISKEYDVQTILVGKPQTFEKSQEVNIRRIDDFINTLKKRTTIYIDTWDESYSTSNAKDMLLSLGQHFKKSKDKIDSVAASVFLQEYLNSKQK